MNRHVGGRANARLANFCDLAGARRAARRSALASSMLAGGAGVALLMALGTGAAQAQTAPLPTGGEVVSGSATIATGATGMTVTQGSSRAIVNWTSFDVAENRSVVFVQPDAASATLNRVTGDAGSTIAGRLAANGAVFLVNPNGIAITATGNVKTGGGFVASTLDIADADFHAGRLSFAGKGASRAVTNAGRITVGSGGFAALLGGSVSNSGSIVVPLGRVGLGSGESIALDLNGGGFLQVAVPTEAITGGNTALIEMAGSISASGGLVELRAATVKDAVRNVVNLPGSVNVDSATGSAGTIILHGGDGGSVRTNGTLSARATGASGDGGFVETSGALVDYSGLKVDTVAANGTTGTWLIDPVDLTVNAAAAATISANLASSNVTLATTDTAASGPGNQSPGAGDIFVQSAISWTSANTLSLNAYRNIAISAAISGVNGGLTLTAGNGVANAGTISATGAVQVGIFNLTNGAWRQVSLSLPTFAATDFRLTVANASFVRARSGTGASATPYMLVDIYGVQGAASVALLAQSFTLANNIDASGTATWNAGRGFAPIALVNTRYSGIFDGAKYVINGLTVNRPGESYGGLFGLVSGTVRNLGSTNVSITAAGLTGGLVAQLTNGTVTNSYVTGSVSGLDYVGGLVGYQNPGTTISYSYSAANVTGSSNNVGGLVGQVSGTLNNSYATGNVTQTGGEAVGGLVGYANGTITNVYATGAVSGTLVGGILGNSNGGALSNAWASGRLSGTNIGGVVGRYVNFSTGMTNVYWDSYSTGTTAFAYNYDTAFTPAARAYVVTSDPSQSAAANYAYKSSAYSNLPAALNAGAANASGFIHVSGGVTRPFLAFEVPGTALLRSVSGAAVIVNSHQLQLMTSASLASSYRLGNDISMAETRAVTVGVPASYSGMWSAGGFMPVANSGIFGGSFNGDGYRISDLTINQNLMYTGLFGRVGSATISNLGLVNVNIRGSTYTGALIGSVSAGSTASVSDVYVTGAVTGSSTMLGGLIGDLASGTVTRSYSTASVTGSGAVNTGGLIGRVLNATVSYSYATGAVTSSAGGTTGGLIGGAANAQVSNSYATGNVSATGANVGGLIGSVSSVVGSSVSYSWSSGNVSSTATGDVSNVGGLIGNVSGSSTATPLTQVYATGSVTSNGGTVGGLIGSFGSSGDATLQDSYATGAVNGTIDVGGLIGIALGGTIRYSYASGAVTGTTSAGGFLGTNLSATLVSNIWDAYSSGRANAVGSGSDLDTYSVTSDPAQAGSSSYAFKAGAYGIFGSGNWVFLAGNSTRPFLAFEVPTTGTRIVNSHQLQLLGYNQATMAGAWQLGANIDLSETGRATGAIPGNYSGMWAGTGFVPIGSDGAGNTWDGSSFRLLSTITSGIYGFTGSLVGNGYTLSNLGINRAAEKNVGLFSVTSGSFSGFTLTGNVTGNKGVGGLVGLLRPNGTVTSVNSAVNVTGTILVGGLVGSQAGSTAITLSSASGAVSGIDDVGGLVGYVSGNGTITRSYATGTVSGATYVGGLVGLLFQGTVANSYATGAVTGTNQSVGGLIGYAWDANVSNGYSRGAVSGTSARIGGLVGQVTTSTITNSYWDVTTSGQAASAAGSGRTTLQMQDAANYIGWNFATIWFLAANSYPTLRAN